jgi:hypothetical protein
MSSNPRFDGCVIDYYGTLVPWYLVLHTARKQKYTMVLVPYYLYHGTMVPWYHNNIIYIKNNTMVPTMVIALLKK